MYRPSGRGGPCMPALALVMIASDAAGSAGGAGGEDAVEEPELDVEAPDDDEVVLLLDGERSIAIAGGKEERKGELVIIVANFQMEFCSAIRSRGV